MFVIHLIAPYLLMRVNVDTFYVLHCCIYGEVLFCQHNGAGGGFYYVPVTALSTPHV